MGYRDALIGGLLLWSGLRGSPSVAGLVPRFRGARTPRICIGGIANHDRMTDQQKVRGLGGAALGIGIGVLGAAGAQRSAVGVLA